MSLRQGIRSPPPDEQGNNSIVIGKGERKIGGELGLDIDVQPDPEGDESHSLIDRISNSNESISESIELESRSKTKFNHNFNSTSRSESTNITESSLTRSDNVPSFHLRIFMFVKRIFSTRIPLPYTVIAIILAVIIARYPFPKSPRDPSEDLPFILTSTSPEPIDTNCDALSTDSTSALPPAIPTPTLPLDNSSPLSLSRRWLASVDRNWYDQIPINKAIVLVSIEHGRLGVGDQLQQVLHSVLLAIKHNMYWISSGPLVENRHAKWSDYFDLEADELTMDQLPYLLPTRIFENHLIDGEYHQWIRAEEELVQIRDDCIRRNVNCMIRLHRVNIPCTHEEIACHSHINRQLRRKHCFAQLYHPISALLFPPTPPPLSIPTCTNYLGTVPIAVHYRSGDLAYDYFLNKRQSMDSVIKAMFQIDTILREQLHYMTKFYVFSERPDGADDDETKRYFSSILETPLSISLILGGRPEATLYSLISAPVLLGSGSGFVTIASLMRYGVTIGIRPTCIHGVKLSGDGTFDEVDFVKQFQSYSLHHDVTNWLTFTESEQCNQLPLLPDPAPYHRNTSYKELSYFSNPDQC